MKNMKKKFLIIFFTLNLISLVSCWEHCKDYEFYDYSGINIVVQNPNVIENDSLSFGLLYLGGEYLSKSKTTLILEVICMLKLTVIKDMEEINTLLPEFL